MNGPSRHKDGPGHRDEGPSPQGYRPPPMFGTTEHVGTLATRDVAAVSAALSLIRENGGAIHERYLAVLLARDHPLIFDHGEDRDAYVRELVGHLLDAQLVVREGRARWIRLARRAVS